MGSTLFIQDSILLQNMLETRNSFFITAILFPKTNQTIFQGKYTGEQLFI